MGKIYLCEECGFKSDKIKICCGLKMVDMVFCTKNSDKICWCDL